MEEMEKFTSSFPKVARRFRLVDKIGEGTFSSVYIAEDLEYDMYDNSWDLDRTPPRKGGSSLLYKRHKPNGGHHRRKKFVAIKRIYVTSSPQRILNELVLLDTLSGCPAIAPLITAFRDRDQIVAILPYFKHADYRAFYRTLPLKEFKYYLKSLFVGLDHVHKHEIIHRDVKPTNFLYNPEKRRGVLVDFGLAEMQRQSLDPAYCTCRKHKDNEHVRHVTDRTPSNGYYVNDSRPGRRANRAGTRGFRAPEVLLKCLNQTTKIDVWAAGVILLSFVAKRFPFFNSPDDIDAMIEISTIFGKTKMATCSLLHGAIFECTIPTIHEQGYTLEEIVKWSVGDGESEDEDGSDWCSLINSDQEPDFRNAIDLLERCLEVDFRKRLTAKAALRHPFLQGI
ncbi:kinase-like domain-containing protein [Lipomyces arxii]|uniref:kinase-like domain-containing protein n=1 Tax=Lipomyces arxii TaxID=56418 RepID=UPI0034CD4FA5